MTVGQLAERSWLPALEPADPVRQGLSPEEPSLPVEGDPVRIHLREFEQHLAAAPTVDREQPPRRSDVEAKVLLRTGIGEVEPAVGSEGQVVRTVQLPAGDLRAQQLDHPVRPDALDAG